MTTVHSCWGFSAATAIFLFSNVQGVSAAEIPPSPLAIPDKFVGVLEANCFGCHAHGESKGSFSIEQLLRRDEKFLNEDQKDRRSDWHRVLKQLRAGLMPPAGEPRPTVEETSLLQEWIVREGLGLDLSNPDPGQVTVRRLNRVEYRNTIRDLLDYDFDAQAFFPADDTGHGFDNLGDVLSISPLLLEKYIDAANEIVKNSVPERSSVMRKISIPSERLHEGKGPLELSYYKPQVVRFQQSLDQPGTYQLELRFKANETYVDNQFDRNKCKLSFSLDGERLLEEEFVRQGGKRYSFTFTRELASGEREFVLEITPLTTERQIRNLRLSIESIELRGPDDPSTFVKPDRYDKIFPRPVPESAAEQRAYARELLTLFAQRAFRREVDDATIDRLVAIVAQASDAGKSFEAGVSSAMTAILASPRFLFREEQVEKDQPEDTVYPLIDEYALASRLSYMLWSTMPDDELLALAREGRLRANFEQQLDRMLSSGKIQAFHRNFVGQWLQSRAIESVEINARAVLRREETADAGAESRRRRFFELARKGNDRNEEENAEFEKLSQGFRDRSSRGPQVELTREVRQAMRREVELLWEHAFQDGNSLLDLLNGRFTFLNAALAKHYQIENVNGEEMQRIDLPPESPRGGILTTGTVLAVTSNPDRTSPVKRGLFILENLLGTPTGAPPPNIPALDEGNAGRPFERPKKSLREALAVHREDPACAACHDRMDPLGLALENFNALGRFREKEVGKPIDPSGTLVTGEAFQTINQLKDVLARDRKLDFYRCLAEKLLTYALGRAMNYEDTATIDRLVQQLDESGGNGTVLLKSIVRSNAFQRTRNTSPQRKQGAQPTENDSH